MSGQSAEDETGDVVCIESAATDIGAHAEAGRGNNRVGGAESANRRRVGHNPHILAPRAGATNCPEPGRAGEKLTENLTENQLKNNLKNKLAIQEQKAWIFIAKKFLEHDPVVAARGIS